MDLALVLLVLVAQEPAQDIALVPEPARLTHGPFLGHIDAGSARIWARASRAGTYSLVIGGVEGVLEARAEPEHDFTLEWLASDLAPDREYRYSIHAGETELLPEAALRFRTTAGDDAPRTVLAFGSCANDRRFPLQPIWNRIWDSGAEAIVVLGDTPYIDSTELAVQRRRYREFYALPELAAVWRALPLYATWDDHDFGANDTDGTIEGKEFARQAFDEYHPNPSCGMDGAGIFTSFRRGPVEVFLLDARWFSGTGPSPFDPEQPTLLGAVQWKWLERALVASTAPFKILATGMIWNGATRPGKRDHWMSYPHERDAMFRFIGEHGITGVVLLGGDIHRSRALRYPTTDVAGYELTELITSPLANTVIEAANAPSPYLLHDAGVQQTFLLVTVDASHAPATLLAQCLDVEGRELFAVRLSADALQAASKGR